GAVLCRPGRAAADAVLGPDAGGKPDHDRLCTAAGPAAGPVHRADGAGAEPDGRRTARPARPAAQAGAMSLLQIRDLDLAIGGTPILSGVSLSVAPGQIVAITGESGSGKSLTALSILRLLPEGAVPGGSIRLDGA